MLYKACIKPLLFLFPPETAHHLTTFIFKIIHSIPGVESILNRFFTVKNPLLEKHILGLTFPNPVGLAAGFDKKGNLYKSFKSLGFGFIELGTVTPLPQDGNPKPRMFRLPLDNALINRMGFNNAGLEAFIKNLKNKPKNLIIGGNIGKNKLTPNQNAVLDYQKCFEALFPFVDYFVVNVSSPNTPGLRELQDKKPLAEIINTLNKLNQQKLKPKPILLKIAPDLNKSQLQDIVDLAKETNLSGIIATNTTVSRDNLKTPEKTIQKIGNGGLSGKPVFTKSTEIIAFLSQSLGKDFPIIAVGGIFSANDAIEKLQAGASLVQVYTGLIYKGPELVKNINLGILKHLQQQKL